MKSSTISPFLWQVKFHLDGVAVNAASVLAVEAALATCGIVVARVIARSGLYRRRRVRSNLARALAMVTAAAVITIFNVPNFALISRSLSNHDDQAVFTQASLLWSSLSFTKDHRRISQLQGTGLIILRSS